MTFLQLSVFIAISLLAGVLTTGRSRTWLLMSASIGLLYWLQPASPIRNLDFWLPTVTLGLVFAVYGVTRLGRGKLDRADLAPILITLGLILLIGALRYFSPVCCLTATPPPILPQVMIALLVMLVFFTISIQTAGKKAALIAGLGLIGLFFFLKNENLALFASQWLRDWRGQAPELAAASDIVWLGYSYIAFRLLHVIQDYRAGRLPAFRLDEFVTYAIFFPAVSAGPIDRVARFAKDMRASSRLNAERFVSASQRIVSGLFKKFVLADTLALVALNAEMAPRLQDPLWSWVVLYAYTLRIYLDFAGYTDIAIGIGQLAGIQLPENFNRPYLQTNLAAFWNNWHMTLTQWFRAYFFNPLSRSLRTRWHGLSITIMVFISQVATMLLIGLWHGISWNFLIWGAWHGLGLFAHNRWREWVAPRLKIEQRAMYMQKTLQTASWALTFHYIALGWVWFALPDPEIALRVLQLLLAGGA